MLEKKNLQKIKKIYNHPVLSNYQFEMNIWVLTSKKEYFSKYSNKRYIEEAKKRGLNCKMVSGEDIDILLNKEDEKSVIFEGKKISLPDVIIPKTGSYSTYFMLALIRHFEKLGVFVLNPASAIAKAKDKLHTLQLLSAKGLPIPKTLFAKFPIDQNILEREFSYPFVMKKTSGSLGKGVMLIKTKQQLEDILGLLEDQNNTVQQNLIFQEFIEYSQGRDLRVMVIGGKAIGTMQRIAKEGDFRANFSAGGSVSNFEITPEIEWLAIEAAKILNLYIAGVDLLFDKEGYKICEVNSSPQFEGFEKATGINIPQKVFDFIAARSQNVFRDVNSL
jgi:RimK family alpha-L-glutamate ligase